MNCKRNQPCPGARCSPRVGSVGARPSRTRSRWALLYWSPGELGPPNGVHAPRSPHRVWGGLPDPTSSSPTGKPGSGLGGKWGTQCVIPADRPNLAGPGRGLDAGAQKAATRAAQPALGPGGAGTPNSRRRPASGPGQRAP